MEPFKQNPAFHNISYSVDDSLPKCKFNNAYHIHVLLIVEMLSNIE